jgi:hypothetical protein
VLRLLVLQVAQTDVQVLVTDAVVVRDVVVAIIVAVVKTVALVKIAAVVRTVVVVLEQVASEERNNLNFRHRFSINI